MQHHLYMPVLSYLLLSTAWGLELKPVKEWEYDSLGKAVNGDIICGSVVDGIPAPPTSTAAQALDALCSSRSHYFIQPAELTTELVSTADARQPYFSNSLLDAFLAGRFGGEQQHLLKPHPSHTHIHVQNTQGNMRLCMSAADAE
jgi:hypothetical protein